MKNPPPVAEEWEDPPEGEGAPRGMEKEEGRDDGEEIGEVGDMASLNGIKLYFQISEGTRTLDPLQWLKTK